MAQVEENRLSTTLKEINTMVKVKDVKDREALWVLLRSGRAFNPMEGYVAAVHPVRQSEQGAGKQAPPISQELFTAQEEGWEQRVSHGGKGEPYDFMPYEKISGRYEDILSECRLKGFGRGVDDADGYSYRLIAGGLMRRKTGASIAPVEEKKRGAPRRKRQSLPKPSRPKTRTRKKAVVKAAV